MNEEEAFLQAIYADYDNHEVRLIYADWLEEQGDELSLAKAQLVRLEADDCKRQSIRFTAAPEKLVAQWFPGGYDWLAQVMWFSANGVQRKRQYDRFRSRPS